MLRLCMGKAIQILALGSSTLIVFFLKKPIDLPFPNINPECILLSLLYPHLE